MKRFIIMFFIVLSFISVDGQTNLSSLFGGSNYTIRGIFGNDEADYFSGTSAFFEEGLREMPVQNAYYGNLWITSPSMFLSFYNLGTSYMTTTDMVTITQRTAPFPPTYLAFCNIYYIIGNGTTNYSTSTDGVNWTSRTLPESLSAGVTQTYQVQFKYCNGIYFLFSSIFPSVTKFYTSTDCINWTQRDGSVFNGGMGGNVLLSNRMLYFNSLYFMSSNSQYYYTSSDGITWTQYTYPKINGMTISVQTVFPYGSGKVCLIGYNSSVNNRWTFLTTDLSTWNQKTSLHSLSSATGINKSSGYKTAIFTLFSTSTGSELYKASATTMNSLIKYRDTYPNVNLTAMFDEIINMNGNILIGYTAGTGQFIYYYKSDIKEAVILR